MGVESQKYVFSSLSYFVLGVCYLDFIHLLEQQYKRINPGLCPTRAPSHVCEVQTVVEVSHIALAGSGFLVVFSLSLS